MSKDLDKFKKDSVMKQRFSMIISLNLWSDQIQQTKRLIVCLIPAI